MKSSPCTNKPRWSKKKKERKIHKTMNFYPYKNPQNLITKPINGPDQA